MVYDNLVTPNTPPFIAITRGRAGPLGTSIVFGSSLSSYGLLITLSRLIFQSIFPISSPAFFCSFLNFF
ncbi:hypothetical protein D6810_00260 [Candidatus Dojkabacteria bacterium]|uniref:Uncharacterized protein n=1 Tax=Candidatus Dojkabacteria bacterium TaxID=2099670 RepID=A0A3M0Z1R6_9BACT|nr:MAG: hypothetical protein D6810_00260 [Candidatus Dojkabacteria bacterium]